MPLINGRGQLGEKLNEYDIPKDIDIYHTWNIDDKSDKTQEKELKKFKRHVDETTNKIVFISTSTNIDSSYKESKRAAESYLVRSGKPYLVIRLPTLIGKGIFQNLKNKTAEPFGIIKFSSIDLAAKFISLNLHSSGIVICPFWAAPAQLIQELIEFSLSN